MPWKTDHLQLEAENTAPELREVGCKPREGIALSVNRLLGPPGYLGVRVFLVCAPIYSINTPAAGMPCCRSYFRFSVFHKTVVRFPSIYVDLLLSWLILLYHVQRQQGFEVGAVLSVSDHSVQVSGSVSVRFLPCPSFLARSLSLTPTGNTREHFTPLAAAKNHY